MDIKTAIAQLVQKRNLSSEDMTVLMREIMSGNTTDAQIGAFLTALQCKGIESAELLGAATVMRELVTRVEVPITDNLVDTCGTGGSGSNKFNVSTASALVAACAGAAVAKHGNRSATSKSGSADVLEAAGVKLMLSPKNIARCINEIDVGFMFAQGHHSAMKHVMGPRKELGIRTMFNLLGPLTNPASAPNQLLGVFDPQWIPVMLEALASLGSQHVLIVSSEDGLDEISISANCWIGELKNGEITNYQVSPEDFGMTRYEDYSMLVINSVEESLSLMKKALCYEHQAAGDIVALNSGAAIYAANLTTDLSSGVEKAREILHTGIALEKLRQLADFTSAAAD